MNKEILKYRSFWQLGFTAFLAVMLTLAPCSVRNAIERSLEIETTTVSNKGKTAEVRSHICISVDIQQDKTWKKADFPGIDVASATAFLLQLPARVSAPKHFLLTSYMGEAVKIPFYILYRNFKFHL